MFLLCVNAFPRPNSQTLKFHSPVSPDPRFARSGSQSHPPLKKILDPPTSHNSAGRWYATRAAAAASTSLVLEQVGLELALECRQRQFW